MIAFVRTLLGQVVFAIAAMVVMWTAMTAASGAIEAVGHVRAEWFGQPAAGFEKWHPVLCVGWNVLFLQLFGARWSPRHAKERLYLFGALCVWCLFLSRLVGDRAPWDLALEPVAFLIGATSILVAAAPNRDHFFGSVAVAALAFLIYGVTVAGAEGFLFFTAIFLFPYGLVATAALHLANPRTVSLFARAPPPPSSVGATE